MTDEDVCLGVCYSENQIFYSVNDRTNSSSVNHIGAFNFNFSVKNAILHGKDDAFSGIKNSISSLRDRFGCTSVRILSPSEEECWTLLPRSVYENPGERESHIRILTHGIKRENIQATWYPVSNVDQRLLLIRNSASMKGFKKLLGDIDHTEYVADFEIGGEWQRHTTINGSFMTVSCYKSHLCVSSFLLGKLRGTTILPFDDRLDLPYLWKLNSRQNTWMSGIHEQIYFYGYEAENFREILSPYWDDSGEHVIMNTLGRMRVSAPEETYGFPLEQAFPAILLSLNYDHQLTEVLHEDHNRET